MGLATAKQLTGFACHAGTSFGYGGACPPSPAISGWSALPSLQACPHGLRIPQKMTPRLYLEGRIFLSGSCVRVGAREGQRGGKTRTA